MLAGSGNSIGTALKVVHILVANVVTFAVMHYIHKQVDEVKHRIVDERRKARCVESPSPFAP